MQQIESGEEGGRTRGNALALIGGAIAGAVAGALGRPERAAAGHDATNVLHLGEANTAPAGSATRLLGDVDEFAFTVQNDSTGASGGGLAVNSSGGSYTLIANQFSPEVGLSAVFGHNWGGAGIGVQGHGEGGGTGVSGGSDSGAGVSAGSVSGDAITADGGNFGVKGRGTAGGVVGESESGFGVSGASVSDTGVAGSSSSGNGMTGDSDSGFGVTGRSQSAHGVDGTAVVGIGVFGHSGQGNGVAGECNDAGGVGTSGSSTDGIGVHAVSQNGQALRVEGRAVFSTVGAGVVPQGQSSVFVANPAVRAGSHVSVTLVGNPGIRLLHWVERSPGLGFTVRLTPAPGNQRPATPFTYFIVQGTA